MQFFTLLSLLIAFTAWNPNKLLHMGIVKVNAVEVEIDSGGNFVGSNLHPGGISVNFYNAYDDKSIDVFWDNREDDENDIYLFKMEPKSLTGVNTFAGHHFYAIESDKGKRVGHVHVNGVTSNYTFGHVNKFVTAANNTGKVSSSRGKHENRIRIIGYRTNAMSAKFRCLAPNVEYYYDDGMEGSFQGSLTVGKETTTNTYEGHVFYFVRPGKKPGEKGKEIARFTMKKEQVSLFILF